MGKRGKIGASGAAATLLLLVAGSIWISRSAPHVAGDYEDCVEQAQTVAESNTEYSKLIIHCGERFAGRRKPGGARSVGKS